jgi:carboxylesterase type B
MSTSRIRRSALIGVAVFSLAAALTTTATATQRPDPRDTARTGGVAGTVAPVHTSITGRWTASPVATTQLGAVRGVSADGVDSFLGMRYAQAPVGKLRWTPPKPVAPWHGTVSATAYGNRCPASASGNGPESLTEDCLFLNVQRPADTRPGARLPVYVWIHGGGLENGSSNQFDGTQIVAQTGAIVVTLNYRLGLLGWLTHPALIAERGEGGNYGFLDQQAALRWVQRNIASFGGDPARVTIGGESSGAWSVCAHLSAPGSRGLFAQAVIESGNCVSWTLDADLTSSAWIVPDLGCTMSADPSEAACLRKLSVADLLAANDASDWGPGIVSGTPTLPQVTLDAVTSGHFAHVPILVGANRDEGRGVGADFRGASEEQYAQTLSGWLGDYAPFVLASYPWPATSDEWTAAYLIGAVVTDAGWMNGGCPGQAMVDSMAAFTTTYAYQFDHRTGPGLTPLPGYEWGATHAAEQPYMWPSFDNGTPIAATFDASERRLARDMTAYWGSFLWTGRPGSAGGARWPRLDPQRGDDAQLMSLRAGGHSTPITDGTLFAQHQCSVWGF